MHDPSPLAVTIMVVLVLIHFLAFPIGALCLVWMVARAWRAPRELHLTISRGPDVPTPPHPVVQPPGGKRATGLFGVAYKVHRESQLLRLPRHRP
jgi:hypothetical protein